MAYFQAHKETSAGTYIFTNSITYFESYLPSYSSADKFTNCEAYSSTNRTAHCTSHCYTDSDAIIRTNCISNSRTKQKSYSLPFR